MAASAAARREDVGRCVRPVRSRAVGGRGRRCRRRGPRLGAEHSPLPRRRWASSRWPCSSLIAVIRRAAVRATVGAGAARIVLARRVERPRRPRARARACRRLARRHRGDRRSRARRPIRCSTAWSRSPRPCSRGPARSRRSAPRRCSRPRWSFAPARRRTRSRRAIHARFRRRRGRPRGAAARPDRALSPAARAPAREELIALRDSARDYRLIAAALGPGSRAPRTRDEEERLLAIGGVGMIGDATGWVLTTLKRSLGARTVALLWVDDDGERIKLKEVASTPTTSPRRRGCRPPACSARCCAIASRCSSR